MRQAGTLSQLCRPSAAIAFPEEAAVMLLVSLMHTQFCGPGTMCDNL